MEIAACCQVAVPFGNGGLLAAGVGPEPRPAPVAGAGGAAGAPPALAGGVAAACPAPRAGPAAGAAPRALGFAPPHWMITGTLPAALAGVVTDAPMFTAIAG